jgi:midasin (ATPase involved in ribosome maturation)
MHLCICFASPSLHAAVSCSSNTLLYLLLVHYCLQESRLTDGAGQRPAYSLRSLCRALDYARRAAPAYGLQRALWDGFSMSFLTQLSPEAGGRLQKIMVQHLLPGGAKSLKVTYITTVLRMGACRNKLQHTHAVDGRTL